MDAEHEASKRGFNFQLGTNNIRKKVKVGNGDVGHQNRELVTGFSDNGIVSALKPSSLESSGVRIIPNQGNDFRGLNGDAKRKRFVPKAGDIQRVEDGEDRFEVAAQEEVKTEVRYGLNIIKSEPGTTADPSHDQSRDDRAAGRGAQVIRSGNWEAESFKRDMAKLPDQATLEQYEQMPVEHFGEAMLRGMGWTGDKDTQAQALTFVRRPNQLGLGATPVMPSHDKSEGKPGHRRRENPKDMVVYGKDGKIKHTMREGDKLVERKKAGPAEGKTMQILKGRHEGLKCRVVTIHVKKDDRSQTALVKLLPSEAEVSVRLKDLGELDQFVSSAVPSNASRGQSKQAASAERPADGDARSRRADAERDVYRDERQSRLTSGPTTNGSHQEHRQEGGAADEPWLAPHIRVKIIDKQLKKGRLYLKKGEITDVLSPHTCTVYVDDGTRVDVDQDQVETSVPRKEGVRVLIVLGSRKGRRAKMLKRNPETAQAALQLVDDLSIVKCDFSEFAEYLGPLTEDE